MSNRYRLTLYAYRFWYTFEGIRKYVELLATSRLRAIDKLDGKVAYDAITRHNKVMAAEYNEWAMCEARSWEHLIAQ